MERLKLEAEMSGNEELVWKIERIEHCVGMEGFEWLYGVVKDIEYEEEVDELIETILEEERLVEKEREPFTKEDEEIIKKGHEMVKYLEKDSKERKRLLNFLREY